MTDEKQDKGTDAPSTDGNVVPMTKELEKYMRRRAQKKAARSRKREDPPFVLRITSLMDAMTIILCFLLKSFSASTIQVTPGPDHQLAFSDTNKTPLEAVPVAITKKAIMVENKKVVDLKQTGIDVDGDNKPDKIRFEVDASEKRDGDASYFINKLYKALQERATKQKTMERINKKQKFKGELAIIGDRDINFRLLAEVIYTAGQAEFGKLRFVVIQSGPQ